jgi:hypothetical protein
MLIHGLSIHRPWRRAAVVALSAATLTAATVTAIGPATAQQAAPAATAPAKPKPAPKPVASKPAAPKPAGVPSVGGTQPRLLGQYGEWGAYTANPGGKKVCFALAKPTTSTTTPPNRPRNPVYIFISSRPGDKVSNEVSVIAGYPYKPSSEATAQIGSNSFALYTQQDGAWIKNASEESHMIDALRAGDTAVIKGVSVKGTQSADTFSLKGVSQALDRTAEECK